MPSVTVAVPQDLKKEMESFPDINWSGLVREKIKEEVHRRKRKEALLKRLGKENDFNDWATSIVREGRK